MTELVAGRFSLIDPIHSSGTGSVWRAYDHRERRYCAAKVIRQGDPRVLMRAIREQGTRLTHPHVLTPYTWAGDEELVLLAMDIAHGGSLRTLIGDYGPLPARYAAEILAQLLDGLAHLHAVGVTHRDIKPENILLEATGAGAPHIRLGDFGAALGPDYKRLTTTGFAVGTPGFVAPEVLLSGVDPGPRQDLYAAGVVGWASLTGTLRPRPETPTGKAPPGVPAALWSLVAAMRSGDARNRPESAQAALGALTEAALDVELEVPVRTADGELVQVFDHIGPLPAGWGRDGPTVP